MAGAADTGKAEPKKDGAEPSVNASGIDSIAKADTRAQVAKKTEKKESSPAATDEKPVDSEAAAMEKLDDGEDGWKKLGDEYLPFLKSEDIRTRTAFFAKRARLSPEEEESDFIRQFELLKLSGRKSTWITPQIPFMVPLLLGWLSALVLGNLIFWGIYQIIQAIGP